MVEPTELIGTWLFERTIADLRDGETSAASGSCELTPEDSDLIHWRERATLRHGGRELPASRDLRIERDGSDWHVRFDDGRYFHPWLPGEEVTHPCGPDIYNGVIDLSGLGDPVESWQMTWRVRGPRKDLRIHTRLSRAGGFDGP